MSAYDYNIQGADLQMLEIALQPGQSISAEAGAMVYMGNGIGMSTTTGGGLFSGFKRMLGGGGLFLTTFTNEAAHPAKIGFAAPYPGKVEPIKLSEHGHQLLAHKDSFLCASSDTKVEIAFTQKFLAGLFGGGVISDNMRPNQRKIIRYNHLLANILIFILLLIRQKE